MSPDKMSVKALHFRLHVGALHIPLFCACFMQAYAAASGDTLPDSDGCATVRRFLVDECAQTHDEDRAGIRIRCVDFFERFKEWGGASTHRFGCMCELSQREACMTC